MKNKLVLIISLLVFSYSNSQKVTLKNLKNFQLEYLKKSLNLANDYKDSHSKMHDLLSIISIEGKNSIYKDSLAFTYLNNRKYLSAHLISEELLLRNPKNINILEVNAISLLKMNSLKEAILAYEQLFPLTNSMFHGYQLAFLQYNFKRYNEAKETITQALNCDIINNAFLSFPLDKQQKQDVPLKAAAFNLKGLISFELKDNLSANNSFKEALKLMPDFATAKQNVKAIAIGN